MYKIEISTSKGKRAFLFKGKPLDKCPSSYKKVDVIGHNIGNSYNPSYLTLYQAKDKTFRYGIYRDGCFYPYYGRFEWIV